tara:strand:+ start:2135 stop:2359 length:225 start_codon:yes stop_codon:yes gene_type:complete
MKKKSLKQKIKERFLKIEKAKETERIEARVLKLQNDRFVLLNRRLKLAAKLAELEARMYIEKKKLSIDHLKIEK